MLSTRASVFGLIGMVAMAPLPAFAQAAAPQAAATTGDEIVVTAQRREEKQVDVPITITALSSAQLTTANVVALPDIAKITPGLRFDSSGGFFQPTIRGVGTPVVTSGGGSNVGIYVDGFYVPNPLAGDFQLTKVQSVQVLKGPQGTLFGHNTTGGAILVQSADPSEHPAMEAKFSYGRFNELKYQFYGTAGIANGVAMDVEFNYGRGNGHWTNISDGTRVGDYRNWSARVGLKAQISDRISVLLRYQHSHVNDPSPLITSTYKDATFGSGAPWFLPAAAITNDPDQTASGAGNAEKEFLHINSNVVQGTIKADLGFADLTSYTQYRKEDVDSSIEVDYSAAPLLQLGLPNDNHTWSQELLLNSKPGSKLQWTAGFFAFSNTDIYRTYLIVAGSTYNPPFRIGGSGTDTNTYAGFFDATYEVMPKLFFTGGIRYSHDSVTNTYFNGLGLPPFDATFKHPLPSISSNHVTPRAILRYKPDDQSSIYASYTQGYKSAIIDAGGSCQNPTNPITAANPTGAGYTCNDVKPEKIHAFEVGYKFDNRTISFELSGFYYDYKNLQVSEFLAGRANIVNAANSKIYGLDGQVRYRFNENFSVNVGAAWTHARYKHFDSAPVYTPCGRFPNGSGASCLDLAATGVSFLVIPTTLDNVHMQRSPEFTATVGGHYGVDLAGGKLDLSGNLFYSSSLYYGPSGTQFLQKGYATLALRGQWTDPSDHFTLAVFGDNVTNSRYMTDVQYSNYGVGANWSKPATYGVEVGVKF
ncbi:MAG: TonB-dependent receptor [Sphingomonadales bacterium]|nr:TonB-dependent receptor [Sphingomonadales bacterium]